MGIVTIAKPRRSRFPDPRLSDYETGILCHGGELSSEILVDAYYHGVFPWPHEGHPMLWFSPKERGVIDFKSIREPKSFLKWKKKQNLTFTKNKAFLKVMKACASVPRKGQDGTWITDQILDAYLKLHKMGFAHSLEGWDGEDLVCGIYGVFVGGVMSAESMFGLRSNTSKLALMKLCHELSRLGYEWMDIQMVTPVTKSFGGELILQEKYLQRLEVAHRGTFKLDWTK